jgi:polar amino acid transport system substrate-binding protein
MRTSVIATILLLGALLLPRLQASEFTIMTEELPPFNFTEEGQPKGITVDLIVRIFADIGQPIAASEVKIMPWARAYKDVQEQPGTVLFSMARTEQREQLFKWVGPVYDLQIGWIAAKAKGITITDPAAAAGTWRIGTVRDGAPEQLTIQAGVAEDKLDRLPKPELNVKKLAADRIDIFAFNVPTAQYLMLKEGLSLDDYQVVHVLKQAQLYIAFHKDTDPALIAKLNAALQALRDNGGYQEIVDRYLGGK